jgi:high-affinity iron transporter
MRASMPVLLLAAAALLAPRAEAAPDRRREARRVAHLLAYVASDYAGAVQGGRVINEAEFSEQRGLLQGAAAALDGAPDLAPALAALRQGQAIFEAHGDAPRLAAALDLARDHLASLSSAFEPHETPDPGRGQALFLQHCAACHGPQGEGNGPQAAQLRPPPADLHDPRVAEWLSPSRIASTTEFGIPGTAMAPLPQLTDEDRWQVAFFAASLVHQGAPPPGTFSPAFSLVELAALDDHRLREDLLRSGVLADEAEGVLASLRTTRPFALRPESPPLAAARLAVQKLRMPPEALPPAAARASLEAARAAVEPLLGPLASCDPALSAALPAALSSLSAALEPRAPDLPARADEARRLLLLADRALVIGPRRWRRLAPLALVAAVAAFGAWLLRSRRTPPRRPTSDA